MCGPEAPAYLGVPAPASGRSAMRIGAVPGSGYFGARAVGFAGGAALAGGGAVAAGAG